MRRRSIVLVGLLAALTAGLAVAAPTGAGHDTVPSGRPHAAGELIVRFEPGLGRAARRRILGRHEATLERSLRAPGLELVRLDEASLAAVAAELEREPGVLDAQPNYIYRVSTTPNDPAVRGALGSRDRERRGHGRAGGLGCDDGQRLGHGGRNRHRRHVHASDLTGNVWSNSGEAADGLDNDGNGHVDDLRGWDFVDDDGTPTDPHGHGTHVAGTVGAEGNNGVGVTGVNWDVGVMPLRAGDAAGYFTDETIADAMSYACAEGADIVNGSFGGEGYSPVIASAIGSCPGTLFVFAAGNGSDDGVGDNIDASPPIYPCAFTNANVVCVAASTEAAGIASFSNYGPVSVDVAAPGTGILSTVSSGTTLRHSGTSMASPHVAGVAALLLARYPAATPAQIKYSLMRTVDPLQAFAGKIATQGRVNAFSALTAPLLDPPAAPPPPPPPPPPADTVPPSNASPVSTSHPVGAPTTRNTIVMTWSGAFDQGSGVDGFSYHWDQLATSTPDEVKDAEETSTGITAHRCPAGATTSTCAPATTRATGAHLRTPGPMSCSSPRRLDASCRSSPARPCLRPGRRSGAPDARSVASDASGPGAPASDAWWHREREPGHAVLLGRRSPSPSAAASASSFPWKVVEPGSYEGGTGSMRVRFIWGLLAIFAVVGGSAVPSDAFPGANGKIAFVCFEGNSEICTMEPNGSSQVNISQDPNHDDSQPAWSADGTQIVYTQAGLPSAAGGDPGDLPDERRRQRADAGHEQPARRQERLLVAERHAHRLRKHQRARWAKRVRSRHLQRQPRWDWARSADVHERHGRAFSGLVARRHEDRVRA